MAQHQLPQRVPEFVAHGRWEPPSALALAYVATALRDWDDGEAPIRLSRGRRKATPAAPKSITEALAMTTNRVGDTPSSRCGYYRKMCDLPTRFDPDSGRITMRTNLIWAIVMPSDLGQRTKVCLEHRGRGGGPIISHPRSGGWTFLVRSDIALATLNGVKPYRVRVIGHGEEIALPSPADRGSFFRAWIVAAHTPHRPSGGEVMDAVRTVLDLPRVRIR